MSIIFSKAVATWRCFCYNNTDYKYILGLNAHLGGEDMNKKL